MKQDVYHKVTDKIIADLEKGELTWLKPWNSANTDGRIIRPLRHNGMGYNGINILMLWSAALEHGFQSPFWMTFNQAKEFGAHVRKGEAGSLVVYANTITKSEEQEDGTEEERKIPFMKGYTVFNVEQIEGLPERFYVKPEPMAAMPERIPHWTCPGTVEGLSDNAGRDRRTPWANARDGHSPKSSSRKQCG
jgi:antirestriction protein ArdC